MGSSTEVSQKVKMRLYLVQQFQDFERGKHTLCSYMYYLQQLTCRSDLKYHQQRNGYKIQWIYAKEYYCLFKSGNSEKLQMANETSQLQNDKYYNYSNQDHRESRIMAAKDFKGIGSHYWMGRVSFTRQRVTEPGGSSGWTFSS